MKHRTWTIAVAAVLLAAGAAVAQPYGMGRGSMGYGMGAGPMGGWGMDGYGMGGPGMRWDNDAAYDGLDLTAEQRKKITDIRYENSKAAWQLMGQMHEQGYRMHGMFGPGALDEAAARKSYQAMADMHKAMFELRLEAQKKIDAVLSPEQREQLRRHWGTR
jgi:Spy/CpxP family protein refolding chaperone